MLNTTVTETPITHADRLWLYAFVTLVLVFLVVPCILVVPMSLSASEYLEFPPREVSLRWYRAFLGSPEWLHALWTSIKVAVPVTILATTLGTAPPGDFIAGLARSSPSAGRSTCCRCWFRLS